MWSVEGCGGCGLSETFMIGGDGYGSADVDEKGGEMVEFLEKGDVD